MDPNDRDAIVEVLALYAVSIDDRQFDQLARCFTPDARATYSGTELAPGLEAIIDHVRRVDGYASSHHVLGLGTVVIDRDVARTVTPAIAYLLDTRDPPTELTMRGLRYRDQLVRTADGWRICERIHEVSWAVRTGADDLIGVIGASATRRDPLRST